MTPVEGFQVKPRLPEDVVAVIPTTKPAELRA